MAKYKNKFTPTAEAVKWTGDNIQEVQSIADGYKVNFPGLTCMCLEIEVGDNVHVANIGDYIKKDETGAISTWGPKEFERVYEVITHG